MHYKMSSPSYIIFKFFTILIFITVISAQDWLGTQTEIPEQDRNDQGWTLAHATFYGDMGGGETMRFHGYDEFNHELFVWTKSSEGACGYGNLFDQGYGLETTALSTALFNDGLECGSCFEIMCTDSPWCLKNTRSIRVTATNFCPPYYPEGPQAWCNSPRKHFDLSMAMFVKLAEYKAGIIPVFYRKVTCQKNGGVKFEFKGNDYWLMILVYNVGGAGNVVGVNIHGSRSGWTGMSRNWGQNWQTWVRMQGEILSFEIALSDGNRKQFWNVAPQNWQLGQTYQAQGNM